VKLKKLKNITRYEIELSFWMKFILKQDYIQVNSYYERGDKISQYRPSHRTDIGISPISKLYPKTTDKRGYNGKSYHKIVRYNPIGNEIKQRIELCIDNLRQSCGEKFFAPSKGLFDFFEKSNPRSNTSRETLIFSEKVLKKFTEKTIQHSREYRKFTLYF